MTFANPWSWIFSLWPDWMREAACGESDPETFFPEYNRDKRVKVAKAICASCPVQEKCLEYALVHCESGIWGGKTEEERTKIKEARREGVQA